MLKEALELPPRCFAMRQNALVFSGLRIMRSLPLLRLEDLVGNCGSRTLGREAHIDPLHGPSLIYGSHGDFKSSPSFFEDLFDGYGSTPTSRSSHNAYKESAGSLLC